LTALPEIDGRVTSTAGLSVTESNVADVLLAVYCELPAYDAVTASSPTDDGVNLQLATPAEFVCALHFAPPSPSVTGWPASAASGVWVSFHRLAVTVACLAT
jgi:hypothetical protein